MTGKKIVLLLTLLLATAQIHLSAQGTRLLRQPAISNTQIAFAYGGDIWVTPKTGGEVRRITSTVAVEANPHFSPDGQWLVFSSNRSGIAQVYMVSAQAAFYSIHS